MTPGSLTITEMELSSPSSTSNSDDQSPTKMDDKTSYRKSNKPMMEKKRRARINSCLSQLKSLVLQAMKKDNSQYSKLEKADILELTVRHLKNVQRYQTGSAAANLPDAVSKYRAGFNECANEVVRYLAESQAISDEARTRILSHLASILSPINALPLQQPHTPILPAPVQQQQQQQLHLSQLHLQQQKQNQNVFLTPSSQPAPVDTNNNKPKLPHPAFLAPTGNTLDINHVISGSPTAFQCPITAAVPAGLQVPCIAATAMATLTQLQLVPSALPSGQLALVLAPHPVPAMNLYPAQEGGRQQADHEAVFTQPHNLARFVECKPEQPLREGPVALVTKASRSHKQGVAPYQRPATPYQTKSSLSHQSTALSFTSSTQSSNPVLQQSEIATAFTEPKTITTVSDSSSSKASSGSFGTNIVRATSTWRPW